MLQLHPEQDDDVGQRDDTDEVAVLDHGQATDAPVGHQIDEVVHSVVGRDGDEVLVVEDRANRCRLRGPVAVEDLECEVPVGDESDGFAVRHNDDAPDLFRSHRPDDLGQRRVQFDGDDPFTGDIDDSHTTRISPWRVTNVAPGTEPVLKCCCRRKDDWMSAPYMSPSCGVSVR